MGGKGPVQAKEYRAPSHHAKRGRRIWGLTIDADRDDLRAVITDWAYRDPHVFLAFPAELVSLKSQLYKASP